MLTEKDYCDYETCVALKELGFKERCVAYYDTEDNVGLLYNTQWTYDVIPCQYCDLLESRNSATEYEVDAPTLYDAQKWLREEKKIEVGASWDNDEDNWYTYIKQIGFPDWSDTSVSHSCYSSYEEALLEGVRASIKILQDEQKENN